MIECRRKLWGRGVWRPSKLAETYIKNRRLDKKGFLRIASKSASTFLHIFQIDDNINRILHKTFFYLSLCVSFVHVYIDRSTYVGSSFFLKSVTFLHPFYLSSSILINLAFREISSWKDYEANLRYIHTPYLVKTFLFFLKLFFKINQFFVCIYFVKLLRLFY